MKKNISEYSFLFVAFGLGWASLYGNALSFLLILLVVVNARADAPAFVRNLKEGKWYLGVPVVFLGYMLLHTLVVRLFGFYDGMKASFGIFETMLLYFITIPLYVMSMKPWMSPSLLKKALWLFGAGVLFFNICVFFRLTGWDIFTNPSETLNTVYTTRYFGNKSSIFGSVLMLEPQAMVLALAAMISCFLFLIRKQLWMGAMALGLLVFLSFTVTKASILAFALGGIVACAYVFKKLSGRQKKITLVVVAVFIVAVMFFLPRGVLLRIHETSAEIENIKVGKLEGGSLAPRIAMWKDAYKHFDEYALCGVGVYYKPVLREWYAASPDTIIADMPNVHNSFLEYWIKGGIPGVLLIVSVFAFPLLHMKRLHRWPFLVLGSMVVVFFASNTCVLFVHGNSLGIILFWLSAFYFYLKDFSELERVP